MSGATIALFHDPWKGAGGPVPRSRPWRLWRKAIWFRANPRDIDYMRALLADEFPGARFLDTDAVPDWPGAAAEADEIVFVYPDSIGLGFFALEDRAMRAAPAARLMALNGRRRQFPLDVASLQSLRLRRFLEWTMILEFGFGAAILAATPFLIAFDFVRGRR